MTSATRLAAILFLSVVILPATAFAQQASITGVVRDPSGAVLPGVTVEASSPALIEQSRSVITDGTGQYRIVDLRPGTYVVTFTLSGFTIVRREGIELTATFVATVNADLRVAAVAETVTVTGESPIVDVQSSQTVRTIDSEVFAGIPSSRSYAAVTVLMPGISAQGADVGGVAGNAFSVFQAHGGRRNEGQVQINGLSIGWQGMGVSGYVPEVGSAQEISFQVTGGLGEAGTGGPQMNLIPREGGNLFRGSFLTNFAGEGWQGSNLTDSQKALGLREINQLVKTWDINPMFGGPLKRDRLWFFLTARHFVTKNTVSGIFINKNALDVTKWAYDPDFSKQAVADNLTKNASARLTWQASARNKVSLWWDEQLVCQRCDSSGVSFASPLTGGSLSPEADGGNDNPIRMGQAAWTSPLTSKVLLEASFGLGPQAVFGAQERPDNNRDVISVIDSAGLVPGIEDPGQAPWARNWGHMYTFGGSLSYITGAHRFKVGGRQQRTNAAFVSYYNNQRLRYNFTNGLPTALTMFANHAANNAFEMYTTAFYAQDQWTAGRLTLQGGIRYEQISSYYPEGGFAVDRFLPTALTFAAQDAGVSPKDIDPRFGASYDLSGNGKTSLKFSLGRYPTADNSYGAYGLLQQPASRVATSTNRNWNDLTYPVGDTRRGNFVPDCNLLNPAADGECGAWANQNFGKSVVFSTYDPNVLSGWNVREYSWDLSAGIQQEIAPRTSLEVTYVRRSWGNQTVTDNRAVGPADFDQFNLTAPVDTRLPNSGGYALEGIYDLKPEKFGQVNNYVTFAKNFGQGRIETYNGVDVNVSARLRAGLTMQGGVNVGQSRLNDCDVWAQLPEIQAVGFPFVRTPLGFCDQASGWLTTVGGLATYVVPKADVQVAATIQSRPFAGANFPGIASQSLAANWIVSNAQVAPALGRPMSGNAALAFVNAVEPGTFYGDRLNQVDLRVSKIFRFGNRRANVGVDLFNLFNTSAVYAYFQTLNTATPATYLQPASLVSARFAKVSVQIDF